MKDMVCEIVIEQDSDKMDKEDDNDLLDDRDGQLIVYGTAIITGTK